MQAFTDSLRGYGYPIHARDGFRCRYCGIDGSGWPNWLFLSVDHLLPKGHPKRNDPDFIVTACTFCNCADNWFFQKAEARRLKFDDMTPDQLINQRKPFVEAVREQYRRFWSERVEKNGQPSNPPPNARI